MRCIWSWRKQGLHPSHHFTFYMNWGHMTIGFMLIKWQGGSRTNWWDIQVGYMCGGGWSNHWAIIWQGVSACQTFGHGPVTCDKLALSHLRLMRWQRHLGLSCRCSCELLIFTTITVAAAASPASAASYVIHALQTATSAQIADNLLPYVRLMIVVSLLLLLVLPTPPPHHYK